MRFAMAAVLLAAACGGSASNITGNNTTPCKVTLSGAVTGTFTCDSMLGGYSSSNNQTGVGTNIGTGSSLPAIGVNFVVPGDLHTGTFKDTDAGAVGVMSVQSTGNTFWAAEAGSSDPKQGSYTATVTDTGPRVAGSSGAAYVSVHGSVTAVLTPVAGTGATGNVNLSATF